MNESNFLATDTGEGRYVFFWKAPSDIPALLRTFGRYAADPELPDFTWSHAARLAKIVRPGGHHN